MGRFGPVTGSGCRGNVVEELSSIVYFTFVIFGRVEGKAGSCGPRFTHGVTFLRPCIHLSVTRLQLLLQILSHDNLFIYIYIFFKCIYKNSSLNYLIVLLVNYFMFAYGLALRGKKKL